MDTRVAIAVFLSLLSVQGWAQDLPELQEVVVTATRAPTDLLASPSFVTVVTQQDIQASGASDLSGVLSRQSGIVVNDYGPQGQGKTVSIRGSTSSQVLVMVDGIRLNSSFDGYVDLSRISISMIDHVEIVSGPGSSMWGTGAVGGVINIITKKPDTPDFTISLTNGSYLPQAATVVNAWLNPSWPSPDPPVTSSVPASVMSLFDNQNLNLSAAGKVGDVGMTAGGSLTRSMNAFVWNDSADLGPWGVGPSRQRNNAQDLAQSAYAGLEVPLAGGKLSTRGTFDHSLIGVPGAAGAYGATPQETQEDTSATGSLSFATSHFLSDALSLDLKSSYRYFSEALQEPAVFSSLHTGNAGTVDATQKLAISDSVSAVYGGSGSFEQIDSTNLSGTNRRLTVAGFVSVPVAPVESLTVTPSLRYDYYSDFPGFLSFQIASVLALSDVSSLRASFGSAYRVPTLSDLYWTDSFGTISNPNLLPETSYSGELGWSLQESNLSLETAIFARLLYNQIEWVYNNVTFTTSVLNITQSFLPGVEVHGKVGLTDWLLLQADYAFIYSFLLQYPGYNYRLTDNQRVPWVPVHNLTFSVKYHNAVHAANVELQYVSEKTYYDVANSVWGSLAGYLLLNAGYELKATSSLTFSIRLLNVLNTLYYTEAGGYPMPPFSIVTGVEVHL
jgi:outer membrane cobalamin receptor